MRWRRLTEETKRRMREEQVERCGHRGLTKVIERNIATIAKNKEQAEKARGMQQRAADAMTAFSGSMAFVYLHAVWFGLWMAVNLGVFGLQPFDPFPFGLLTLIVSLEAIFLSTFVLISQNRQAAVADRRADLDLQINLLAEYEVTRLLMLVDAIADHLEVDRSKIPELAELEEDVELSEVMDDIDEDEQQKNHGTQPKPAAADAQAKSEPPADRHDAE
jgi:uncharacterized membrane protein